MKYTPIPVAIENDVDLSLQIVLRYVNYYTQDTILDIANKSKMDVRVVLQLVRQLVSLGYVKIVDKYQETNEYCCTSNFLDFLKNKDKQDYVLFEIEESLQTVIPFYLEFSDGKSVKEVVSKIHLKTENLSGKEIINKPGILINRGIIINILKRIYSYPLALDKFQNELLEENRSLFDGKHHLDEISQTIDMDISELREILKLEPNVRIIKI